MSSSSDQELDALATALKESAGQLANLLKEQAALKSKLEKRAAEADAAGLGYFAGVFRDLAARLGTLTAQNAKPATSVARRRGRPAKSADDESSAT
jgi:hypothetical protein